MTPPSDGASSSIRHWIDTPELHDLIAAFGGSIPTAPLDVQLRWLDEFSDRWDTRQGAERNQAAELDLTGEQQEAVRKAAHALRMTDVVLPSREHYDHLLVLGGLIRACISRPAYAAHLLASGVTFGRVTGLGGHRPFQGDEFELAARAGFPGLAEEYAALDEGVRTAFRLGQPEAEWGEPSDLPGGAWGVRRYRMPDGVAVDVAAAPSTDPRNRRANTSDTYAWFAHELAALEPGQTVLAVTTPIYVPAQHAVALRMLALPYGVEVETVGHNPDLVPEQLRQDFTPTKYLLEIRSTVRAQLALLAALDANG